MGWVHDVQKTSTWYAVYFNFFLAGYQTHYCFDSDKHSEFWREREMVTLTMWGFNEKNTVGCTQNYIY